MKRNLLLVLALFLAGVMVQTAAVPAGGSTADAEALENEDEHDADDEDEVTEAREEFESIDKNGRDGFLESATRSWGWRRCAAPPSRLHVHGARGSARPGVLVGAWPCLSSPRP